MWLTFKSFLPITLKVHISPAIIGHGVSARSQSQFVSGCMLDMGSLAFATVFELQVIGTGPHSVPSCAAGVVASQDLRGDVSGKACLHMICADGAAYTARIDFGAVPGAESGVLARSDALCGYITAARDASGPLSSVASGPSEGQSDSHSAPLPRVSSAGAVGADAAASPSKGFFAKYAFRKIANVIASKAFLQQRHVLLRACLPSGICRFVSTTSFLALS